MIRPHRRNSLLEPDDDPIDLIIGEVKQGKAQLNADLFKTGRTNVLTVRLRDCAIALADAARRSGVTGAAADGVTGLFHLLAKVEPRIDLEQGQAPGRGFHMSQQGAPHHA